MSLSGLLPVITDDPKLRRALEEADAPVTGGADLIAPPALRPFLAAALARAGGDAAGDAPGGRPRFVLAVTATAREAEDLTAALGSLLPSVAVAYFPPWETLPHERLSPRSDTSGQRLAVLRRLAHPAPADPPSRPLTGGAPPPPGRPRAASGGGCPPPRAPAGPGRGWAASASWSRSGCAKANPRT